jgi:hypothetical protein
VIVEAAHGEDALGHLAAEQVQDGGASLGVLGGGHEPYWLVKEQVAEGLSRLQTFPVDLHRVLLGVCLVAQTCRTSVDGDPAFPDQLLGVAPGAQPGACDELLQPLKAH